MDISKAGELILESRNMRLMDFGRSQVSQGPPSAHSIDDCLAQKVPQGNSNNT